MKEKERGDREARGDREGKREGGDWIYIYIERERGGREKEREI